METYIQTITLSIVLVIMALALISVGWLITGNQKIKKGGCGRDPTKVGKDGCKPKQSCPMCEPGSSEKNCPDDERKDEE